MNYKSLPVLNDPGNTNKALLPTVVPTIDDDVRYELRKLGEPITYFGEDRLQRRERLIKLLAEKPHTNFDFAYTEGADISMEDSDEISEDGEDFYTPGNEELVQARTDILEYSNSKASTRVKKQRQIAGSMNFFQVLKHRRNINSSLIFEQNGTQVIQGNTRAISAVRFSKNDDLLACGSWDGSLFILDSTRLETKCRSLQGFHSEKVTALDWNMVDNMNLLVTGGNEGNMNIWDTSTGDNEKMRPVKSLENCHSGRITKTLFHPSGKYIASTSFDQTWKLWDFERGQELYQQEGHSKEVFSGSFHPDGGLFISGGLDGIIRVWDLRSGRAVSTLQRHSMGIYSIDWSPNGFHFVSASGDCSIKVWDMRKLDRNSSEISSIPAHKKLVSDVRFFKRRDEDILGKIVTDEDNKNPEKLDSDGTFLISSSYDGLINIWSADNWLKVCSLKGHSDKVMSCDVSGNGSRIVSSGWDRTVKLWSI